MQEKSRSKQPIKIKKTYTYQPEELDIKNHIQCPNCSSWQQKTKDLIWGYEELITAKEAQIETLNKMVNQLDLQLKKTIEKSQRVLRKNQAVESQLQKYRQESSQADKLITYYKQRQVSLLSQLQSTQMQLFNKNIRIQDDNNDKLQQEKQLNSDKKQRKNDGKELKKLTKQQNLIPILRSNKSLGRLLQKSLVQVENMGRDKLLSQLKHRMTMLKAIELTILK